MSGLVFSHPWLGGLFGDDEIAELLGATASLTALRAVEAAYARALGQLDLVPKDIAERARTHIETAPVDMDALRRGVTEDGLVIVAFMRQLKASADPELHPAIHAGLTSQDVLDTALMLQLRMLNGVLRDRIARIIAEITGLDATAGAHTLMGRTRMQAALPIRVSDRLRLWSEPLEAHLARLDALTPALERLQLGGPVGDRQSLGPKADQIAASMARTLGLSAPAHAWHTDRAALIDYAGWLSQVTASLGKMGQDMALMAQQGIDALRLTGGGASSAMAHKTNPIKAELLVTLARYNATQISAMHQAGLHEQERSGAAWALEWMVLPQMALCTGRALGAALALLGDVETIGSPG